MNTRWEDWMREITHEESSRQIAAKVNRSHSTILRWEHDPPCDAVVIIALAYGADVVAGLTAAGYMHSKDVANVVVELRRLPAAKLTSELHRRALEFERRYADIATAHTDI